MFTLIVMGLAGFLAYHVSKFSWPGAVTIASVGACIAFAPIGLWWIGAFVMAFMFMTKVVK